MGSVGGVNGECRGGGYTPRHVTLSLQMSAVGLKTLIFV